MEPEAESLSTWRWWERQRVWYNLGLIGAGLIAFAAYVTVVFVYEKRIPDADINFVTTVGQAIGYLVAMAIANIIYFAGPVSERILKPANLAAYRRLIWGLGFGFSVALPFVIPAAVLCMVLRTP